jgi:hypothetical protein
LIWAQAAAAVLTFRAGGYTTGWIFSPVYQARVVGMTSRVTIAAFVGSLLVSTPALPHKLFYREQIEGCDGQNHNVYLVSWQYHSTDGPYFSLQRASYTVGPWTTDYEIDAYSVCYGPVINDRFYRLWDCSDGYQDSPCGLSDLVWVPSESCSPPP